MASFPAQALHPTPSHLHISGERCPWCEQPIPHEKFEEIKNRIAAREQQQVAQITDELRKQFAREKAQVEAKAREDAQRAAAAEADVKLAAAEGVRQDLEVKLQALEKEKAAAVFAEQAKAFEDRQKLQEKLQDLQRQLDNKTAQELGEGAEVDLFEQLKGAFEQDRIRRVLKGTQGADIVHEIVHKGIVCGKIIYDAKNRNAWKSDFVTKLRADQMAERAEHAILSSNKFPAGTQQLHHQDGVIIANPARVLALVELLRRHLLQTHELRISNEERERKTAALYAFITSDRCRQLLDSMETHATRMFELEEAEQKAHRLTWERRDKLIRLVQKVHADLCSEIERIIGADAGPLG
jgi:hypothetical protein